MHTEKGEGMLKVILLMVAIAAAGVLAGAGCAARNAETEYIHYGYQGSQPGKCTSCD